MPLTPTGELHVVAAGPRSLVQDAGRPGWSSVGVGRSGAADRSAWRRGAELVGNRSGEAAIEVLLGGLTVTTAGAAVMAVTGAPATVDVDGRRVDTAAAFQVPAGATVRIGRAGTGLRVYLSVRGGIAVPPTLGSRSTDTLSGLGPPPVRSGDRLPVGEPAAGSDGADPAGGPVRGVPATQGQTTSAPARSGRDRDDVLRVVKGPRDDWFTDPDQLIDIGWTVSPDSDRVGLRLAGGVIDRSSTHRDVELPSEGMVIGALQVPPSGHPVLLMPDHPVTGGYPVIGVLTDASIDRAAQLRPGQPVRFGWAQ